MEKLTIKNIARLADVSTATVSNYLNGNYSRMSEKTRKRLEDMIRETNYVPSSVARGLATNHNKTIGVSVADITNPFTSTVLSGIYDACGKLGYTVVFTNASSDSTREIDNVNKLKHQEVSGLIIDPVDAENAIFKTLSNDSTVMIDRQAAAVKIDSVVTDNYNAVNKFVGNMKKSGYIDEDLYFISWPLRNVSTRLERYRGFKTATGIKDDSHLILVDDSGDDQYFISQIKQIVDRKRSGKVGFFTMNGRVLLHLLKAMQALNYRYPDDVGIGSYEDLDWMEIIQPGISCIHQDSFNLGVTAVNTLVRKLEDEKTKHFVPQLIEVPTMIKMRGSY
ncbi:LacI family DNA-binding transcriptional regulator [Lentilactobacillus otakiensis]|uniref:LacI family DNA-binding transcriptional regulator n=1 Tax=Lentilactobacillus otakiensis TaxID=481720 RepID=UPI00293CF132|nr:LacI family DNA-binding transcriptional regulator [Lentilactobacillus otakiensis]MDV3517358.1 LacI family DNA-binding transcriptional regulator [Lentilactobacillus otakiensis]